MKQIDTHPGTSIPIGVFCWEPIIHNYKNNGTMVGRLGAMERVWMFNKRGWLTICTGVRVDSGDNIDLLGTFYGLYDCFYGKGSKAFIKSYETT